MVHYLADFCVSGVCHHFTGAQGQFMVLGGIALVVTVLSLLFGGRGRRR